MSCDPSVQAGRAVGQSSHHSMPGLWGSLQPRAVCSVLGPAPVQGVGLCCGQAPGALTPALSLQRAPNIVRALELFVKPEQLGGDNAYRCSM